MSEQPETPEGWERRGPCLIREHGGKLAVINPHPSSDIWWSRVHVSGQSEGNGEYYMPLTNAVAWANAQLGVPKPVEVLEEKFADGSHVFKDSEGKRVAFVRCIGIGLWRIYFDKWTTERASDVLACDAAREYVRGAS